MAHNESPSPPAIPSPNHEGATILAHQPLRDASCVKIMPAIETSNLIMVSTLIILQFQILTDNLFTQPFISFFLYFSSIKNQRALTDHGRVVPVYSPARKACRGAR
ncbi:nitrogen regulatory PII-like [Striga asiatica]|uniref:Nitrogen regulatory PII-like n=1 Tax=Striga asiatica TaxID=4170 RepID=A0A5A7QT92_STRAF|nr:nitrogen regulatory PII-like [Striga asiatica]